MRWPVACSWLACMWLMPWAGGCGRSELDGWSARPADGAVDQGEAAPADGGAADRDAAEDTAEAGADLRLDAPVESPPEGPAAERPAAPCGNGRLDPGERCDDGNEDDQDGCRNSCIEARCGDGAVWRGVEECDDGNSDDQDACLGTCVAARCGDGVVWQGREGCDDGNRDDGDACLSSCVAARCGDGVVRRGVEACDDGNADDGDACLASCVLARCGDGVVWRDRETCDDANTVDDDFCDNACRPPVCGDQKRAGAEECDQGPMNGERPAFLISQASGLRIPTDPIIRQQPSQSFYNYYSASSHTGLEQVGESRIYLYADALTGRLSLFTTHGKDDDGGPRQPLAQVQMSFSGLPLGFTVDFVDDPSLPGQPSNDTFQVTGPDTAEGRWRCSANSDGVIMGNLPFPGRWKITVVMAFLTGIETWGWVRHDSVRIPLDRAEPITIEAFDISTTCRTNCTIPRCGDRILDGGEVCDDGNELDGDGCSASCKSLR